MTEFSTWQMPHYVKQWFGEPFTLRRIKGETFEAKGPKQTLSFEAETADDARRVLKSHVAYKLNIKDGRVTRRGRK